MKELAKTTVLVSTQEATLGGVNVEGKKKGRAKHVEFHLNGARGRWSWAFGGRMKVGELRHVKCGDESFLCKSEEKRGGKHCCTNGK